MSPVQYDAIIVGAGVAGLACAERLASAGARVLLLDSEEQVGGRARTDYRLAGGYPLELGAQMIHGRKVVTHEWVRQVGLRVRRLPVMQRACIAVDGRVARFPWMVLPFYPGFGTQNALQGLRGIPRRLRTYEGADQSLAEFLDRANPRRGARLVVELLHAHTYAADPDEIGVLGPNEEDRLASKAFGFRNFQIREGYAELVRRKAAHLNGQVQLASRVKSIRWAEPDVRVQIETGNPLRMREVRARKVVITVSLGVLKQQPELFDPPLPPRKRDAIKAIAFGDAYAIHFRFREAPWPQALGDFSMVWGGGASSFHRPHVGEPLGAEYLDAFTVGREARRRLALSEPEIVQATLDEFRAALARPVRDVPVVGSAMQRWSQMPAFRGAYSYLPVGTGVSARRTLAEPIGGRLFFAGEATHTGGEAATVHGAIETGYRAAEELLQALRTEA